MKTKNKYENKSRMLEDKLSGLQDAVEELKILNEIAVAAGRTVDLDQTLKLILNKTINAVKAEHGAILLLSEDQEILKTFIRQSSESKIRKAPHIGVHITGWVRLNKKSLIIKDLSKDERFKSTEEEKKNIKSLICSPIWFEGKIIGILQMINKKDKIPFNDNDLTLLSIISVQAGQLIKNSQLQQLNFEKKKEAEITKLEFEKLRELDRIKNDFFTNLSHELRTPLTLILGPLENLMGGKENYSEEKLKLIFKNASSLLKLINQLLDLSSIDAKKMRLIPEEGDIVTFVKGIAASFKPLAEIKNIKLYFNSGYKNLNAVFDKDKLEKILNNLLINAIKFTGNSSDPGKSEKIEINIPEKLIDSAGKMMFEIVIEDSGSGISPDIIKNIFERFFTESGNFIKKIPSGTGIGLSLVKELVELHHGSISVESDLNKGTKFRIAIPLKLDLYKEQITGARFSDIKPNNLEDNFKANETEGEISVILIVEDNDDIRDFIKENININVEFIEAVNGKDGKEKAAENIPDLIISDVVMPELDGIELCRQLKTDERTCHIPVILLTSKAEIDNKLKGLETGADDYITKPFSVSELQSRVKNLLNQRKLLRQKFRKEIILEPKDISASSYDENFLKRVIEIIEKHISDPEFSVDQLAKEIGLSSMQVYRKLNALTGQSSGELIKSYRLNKAAKLLLSKTGNISEIGYEVGFNNPAYFATCFRDLFGCSPSEYLQKFVSA
ncbi:MAG: ATP-binding protein [Ignavibacteriaceae bacterium]